MYECHITIAPWENEEQRARIAEVGQIAGFKLSHWVMHNLHESEIEYETFFTSHDKDYEVIAMRMRKTISTLHAAGIAIRRYKIELILLDSKYQGDEQGLLAPRAKNVV